MKNELERNNVTQNSLSTMKTTTIKRNNKNKESQVENKSISTHILGTQTF